MILSNDAAAPDELFNLGIQILHDLIRLQLQLLLLLQFLLNLFYRSLFDKIHDLVLLSFQFLSLNCPQLLAGGIARRPQVAATAWCNLTLCLTDIAIVTCFK